MCGIFGIVNFRDYPLPNSFFDSFTEMVKSTQDRGVDGVGFVGIGPTGVIVEYRSPLKARDAVVTPEWEACRDKFLQSKIVIGVNRAAPLPEGDSSKVKNRPPFIIDNIVVAHNGTISNDRDLIRENGWTMSTEIDTEVINRLWSKYKETETLDERVQNVAGELIGGFTAPLLDLSDPDILVLLHNFKPLAMTLDTDAMVMIYNSEFKNIEAGFYGYGVTELHSSWKTIDVGAFESVIVDAENFEIWKVKTPHRTLSSLPPRNDKKAVVICSGGLDSVTAALVGKKVHEKDVTLLHCNYGQVAKDREWEAVQRVSSKLDMDCKQIDVSYIGEWCKTPLTSKDVELPLGMDSIESTKVFVPARNQLFLTIAGAYCEAKGIPYIYSGFNLEESGCYPDNTVSFFRKMNESFQYGTLLRPQLVLVLERLMKVETIKLAHYLSPASSTTSPILAESWSCDTDGYWHPEDNGGVGRWRACGICGCCSTRRWAYAKARIEDPQGYHHPLREKPIWLIEGKWTDNSASIDELLTRVQATK